MVLRNVEDRDAIKAKVDAIARDQDRLKHAVVIGAGYIRLEMAENLHERGLAVEIVELGDQVAAAGQGALHAHGALPARARDRAAPPRRLRPARRRRPSPSS